jgi:ATP-binding cassette subfamily B protein
VQEKAMLRFFEKNSEDYKNNAIGLAKVEALYFPSMALMIGISTLTTILIGGLQALQDPSKVGIIVEFVIYINMLTFPVSAIGWVASMIQRASASQKRLNEFLHTKSTVVNKQGSVAAELKGDIQFSNVTFTYPHTGITAIKDFTLEIKEGQRVLLLGKTGSGKSTIAQLLLRFYEPTSGQIIVDERPLDHFDINALRTQVSYIPQDVFLFSDTVANNISFGMSTLKDEELVKKAARQASVESEIKGFSSGYETMIGERGVTLSGGQKQRISIARALMKNSPVLLLDDCLSAVDARTERTILGHLRTYLEGKTSIIITHRIFSLLHFDKIIVLQNGEAIEFGTHSELMEKRGVYRKMVELQSRTENLLP